MNNIAVKVTKGATIRVKVSGVTYQGVSVELLALQTGKANAADVTAALALKANTAAMTAADLLKADKATTYTKTENDTALALKADKIRATNLVTNGDFSQGVTGWSGVDGSISTNANVLSYQILTKGEYSRIERLANLPIGKYYLRYDILPKFNETTVAYTSANPPSTFQTVVVNQWNKLKYTFDIINGGEQTLYLIHSTIGGSYSIGDIIQYKNIILIDLTATFGAGNEPTAQEMDRLLAKYPNSWFDGTAELVTLKEVYTEKADIVKATNLVANGGIIPLSDYANNSGYTIDVINSHKYYTKREYNRAGGSAEGSSGSISIITEPWIEFISGIAPIQSNIYTMLHPTRLNEKIYFYGNVPASYSEFKNIILIDLTATFGAGNEPNKEQMDNLLLKYPNSWFDGTTDLVSVADLVNGKANKIQEGWIAPTLLNGWFVQSGMTVGYRKDSFGIVHLKGFVHGGAGNTTVLTLPVGYRPNTIRAFQLASQNSNAGHVICEVATDGNVVIKNMIDDAYISLDAISFFTD